MVTDTGRAPTGQALAKAEPEDVSALSGFDPSRLLLDELNKGITNLNSALDETSTADTFWYRYWAGYLHAYETLRDKLRAAIATEARRAETQNSGSVHEGAGPKDIAPRDTA